MMSFSFTVRPLLILYTKHTHQQSSHWPSGSWHYYLPKWNDRGGGCGKGGEVGPLFVGFLVSWMKARKLTLDIFGFSRNSLAMSSISTSCTIYPVVVSSMWWLSRIHYLSVQSTTWKRHYYHHKCVTKSNATHPLLNNNNINTTSVSPSTTNHHRHHVFVSPLTLAIQE